MKILEYIEPGENDEPVVVRLSQEDAIRSMKELRARQGYVYASDEEALQDFLVVNWATEVEEQP